MIMTNFSKTAVRSKHIFSTALIVAAASFTLPTGTKAQTFRHVEPRIVTESSLSPTENDKSLVESSLADSIVSQTKRRTAFTPTNKSHNQINRITGPLVFSGYRHRESHRFSVTPQRFSADLPEIIPVMPSDSLGVTVPADTVCEDTTQMPSDPESVIRRNAIISGTYTPSWLRKAISESRFQDDFMYDIMVDNPLAIDYAYWELPEPPRLPEDDVSFQAYIRKLDLPEVTPAEKLDVTEYAKRHWLHVFDSGLQFSQAYVSSNWYQGGNDYLALLFNMLWDVQLNTVYHPNLMFNSTLSYKLGLNSTPNDQYHKYSISQDIFQYNLKAGIKAFDHWFYSFNTQFKTQLFNNYPADSPDRSASFLSPGDLNMGLGMTFNKNNAFNTMKLSVSISPISYNLKTCIDPAVDHKQFNIEPDRHSRTEIGSNAEINFDYWITSNINYRTRLFLFSDYKYFLGDWENSISFNINKFLSTQIYLHLRYDSSSDASSSKWRHWMLKEILSFGLSYRFSTKV